MNCTARRCAAIACIALIPLLGVGLPAQASPVGLASPTATFCQTNFPITEAVDGSLDSSEGWAIDPNQGDDFVAVFNTGGGLGGSSGTALAFRLFMLWGDQHTIGRFRLSATTSDPSTFGQGATCSDADPAGGASWTVLTPSVLNSANGQTLTIQPDGSILASGSNPSSDVVTFGTNTPLQGITGIRLEALADAAFVGNGPGRAPNGNFVLTELELDAESLYGVPTLGEWALALTALLLAAAGMLRLRRRG